MLLLGHALIGIAKVLGLVIVTYKLLILARVLMSWLRPDPSHPLIRFVNQVTEPVLYAIRRRLPDSFFRTGIDFAPLLLLLFLLLVEGVLVDGLRDLGQGMVYQHRVENRFILPPDTNPVADQPSGDPIFQNQ